MAYQIVTETHYSVHNIKVSYIYSDTLPDTLRDKKQYKEVKTDNKIMYWVRVPDLIVVPNKVMERIRKEKRNKESDASRNWRQKKKEHYALIPKKKERIERYAAIIAAEEKIVEENGEHFTASEDLQSNVSGIWGTTKDIEDALELMAFEGRKHKSFKQITGVPAKKEYR